MKLPAPMHFDLWGPYQPPFRLGGQCWEPHCPSAPEHPSHFSPSATRHIRPRLMENPPLPIDSGGWAGFKFSCLWIWRLAVEKAHVAPDATTHALQPPRPLLLLARPRGAAQSSLRTSVPLPLKHPSPALSC